MKIIIASIILILLSIPFESYAFLPVIDPTAIIQLMQQVTYLQQEVQTMKYFNWSSNNIQTQESLYQLYNYTQQAGALASSAQSVAQQFQSYYPGYQAPQNYSNQYQQIITNTMTTLNGVMQAMANMNSNNDVQNENSQLNSIQSQIQSPQCGEIQAIQGLSQITVQLVSQLQLLRQTITSQASAQDAYYASQVQQEASNQAEISQVIKNGSSTIGPLNANPITPPTF